ncbi:Kinase domain protein [Arthrobacter sp. 9AX]|uniref:serine/threonine protein kinase n=1 Tax=Arthrobacter sp. 9AX TaxID=2653131 RepID=UPI0012F38457|nr:serine/threonine-protein kinase [Arthrobacter sp. 9AX]VXB13600.1 Kinase domain protein [Arthrobacter sp. 9AX]
MEELQRPRVPGYTVGRLLGHGGSSTVWLAVEERTGREFALKCFRRAARRAVRREAVTQEDIRREIRILSVLDHPHLIRAHNAVTVEDGTDGGTGLIMDYAPAGSLGGLVAARGQLSVGESVTVLTPIAQVLGYLHGQGFTHSDVSPGNVLFTSHGKPMLSDVGMARMLGDPAAAPGRGTPGFTDPAPVDAVRVGLQPERDVYALAALGWFCLTGTPPPRTADRPPLTLLVPEVPRELVAALESGLNEDRRLRPTAPAFATAVYRSAPPLPLDLAPAVHPTVLPELVTRLHAPADPGGLHEKVQSLHRRLTTSKWSRLFTVPQKLPFPTSGPALPVAVHGKGRHAQREHGRKARRGVFAAAAVAIAAAGWWFTGPGVTAAGPVTPAAGHGPSTAPAVPETLPAGTQEQADPADAARQQAGSPDPAAAVQGLSSLRSLAFGSGRFDLLDEVNHAGSAAAAADQRIREPLQASGHTLAGFMGTLSQVQAEEGGTATRAVLALTSAASAYEEKDAQGAVVAAGDAGAEQRLRIVLVSVDGKWRVSEILPGS